MRDTITDTTIEICQRLSHGGVQRNHGAGAVGRRAWRTEFEAVTSEGEGRGAVAVGVVDDEIGDLRDVNFKALLSLEREQVVGVRRLDVVEQFSELRAEERRDDGRRRLVASESVGVGGADDAGFEQSVVAIDGHERFDDERDEAEVLLRRLSRGMEQDARIGRDAPVVVLARAVDAVEGFLVEKHTEAVVAGHALHERHEQHVVVDGQVALLEDRGQLKLVGCHLVVACLARDGQFQGLNLEVLHEGLHAVGDGAEVVVVHLLVLSALVTHQRAACEHQVGAGRVEPLVDEEVLLLPSEIDLTLPDVVVEE